jgi:hypothetical protein
MSALARAAARWGKAAVIISDRPVFTGTWSVIDPKGGV